MPVTAPVPRARRAARLLAIFLAALGCVLAPAWALAGAPPAGTAAPAFRLQDQAGRWVTLDEQRGRWVVLYFYQKDNAPACATQAVEFRDAATAFRDAGAAILGVSVDDVESHAQFAAEHGLSFPILADVGKSTARAYGVFYKALGLMELARRETFLIDPQGRIARHYADVDPVGHARRVLRDLKALQAGGR